MPLLQLHMQLIPLSFNPLFLEKLCMPLPFHVFMVGGCSFGGREPVFEFGNLLVVFGGGTSTPRSILPLFFFCLDAKLGR